MPNAELQSKVNQSRGATYQTVMQFNEEPTQHTRSISSQLQVQCLPTIFGGRPRGFLQCYGRDVQTGRNASQQRTTTAQPKEKIITIDFGCNARSYRPFKH